MEQAIPLFEQTVADRKRVQGSHHPYALANRLDLALAYWSTRDADRAIPLLKQVLADSRLMLGVKHPVTRAAIKAFKRVRAAGRPGSS